MDRTTCRGCESAEVEVFLDLGDMVLAGGFLPDRRAVARERRYPLPIHVCRRCGLVQILQAVDPLILFQDYSFASSTVGPLVMHFSEYARWLRERFTPELVVEFGCNDGVLLAPLGVLGIRACGVDVSQNIGDMARAKGLDVTTGYFDDGAAEALVARVGRADVVTGSNAFAHNDRPDMILRAARRMLEPDGHLCLEVMYAGDLLETLQWDTLYHEHLTFYSLSALQVLLERFDFRIVDAQRLPMHGGSVRVVASANGRGSPSSAMEEILAYERSRAITDPETWRRFGREASRKIDVVRATFESLSRNARICAYGAAGKATMWLNACRMSYLEAVVDSSPLRAGKLMAGTHTPIVFPDALKENPPDYVFVTAWNYAELIRSKESWYRGIWSVPLPDLRFF